MMKDLYWVVLLIAIGILIYYSNCNKTIIEEYLNNPIYLGYHKPLRSRKRIYQPEIFGYNSVYEPGGYIIVPRYLNV